MERAKASIKPVGKKVLMELLTETKTKAGLVLPAQSGLDMSHPTKARVVGIGPECKQVKEGDLVEVVADVSGRKIRADEGEFLCMIEDEILGVVIQ